MTTLVLFATPGAPDGDTRARYEEALRPLGSFALRLIPVAGFSRVFVEEAARLRRGDGRLLPATLEKYAPGISVSKLAFIGYSAGCWYARDGLLRHPEDRAALDACLMLDGLHATEAQLVDVQSYTEEGGRLIVTHTDVQTYGYPSTTETAATLRELGIEAQIIHRDPKPGETQKLQHGRSLTEHGPAVVRDHLVPYLVGGRTDPAPDSQPDTRPDPARFDVRSLDHRLGERCCYWLGHEYGQPGGVVEVPGPEHNPRILSYSEHCRRGGRFMGVRADGAPRWEGGDRLVAPSDEWSWCQIAQSAALLASLRPTDTPPHGLRVSVREAWEDAVRAGTSRPPEYDPQPGDLQILARWVWRGGKRRLADPTKGDNGHVRRYVGEDDEARHRFFGGNESTPENPAGELVYDLDGPLRPELLRGWIAL